jgi:adenylate kinase
VRLVFLGAPGAGKGTQADLLCDQKGWRHISTGDLLRDAVKRGTPLGLRAREAMDRGDLVADDVILGLIEETLDEIKDSGFVLDGFPRTLPQARGLDDMLDRLGKGLDRVLLLTASEEEVMARLAGRGRTDDTPETVRNRLKVYEEKTAPLVDYYDEKGILTRLNGMGDIPEIQERILAAL